MAILNMIDAVRYGYLGGYVRGVQDALELSPTQKSAPPSLADTIRNVVSVMSQRRSLAF